MWHPIDALVTVILGNTFGGFSYAWKWDSSKIYSTRSRQAPSVNDAPMSSAENPSAKRRLDKSIKRA
jgi:hypothetical protein